MIDNNKVGVVLCGRGACFVKIVVNDCEFLYIFFQWKWWCQTDLGMPKNLVFWVFSSRNRGLLVFKVVCIFVAFNRKIY